MNIQEVGIPGLLLIEPRVFGDDRGFFYESWNRSRYREAGLDVDFVQDNVSYSRKGVLRGLHFQHPNPQGKLVQVLQGQVFDVAVDIRVGSPTFGQWHGTVLSGENKQQFYVPPDMAHGFLVLSEEVLFSYKCTDYYSPANEATILWNDPDIGIEWPDLGISLALSQKDRAGATLAELEKTGRLPLAAR